MVNAGEISGHQISALLGLTAPFQLSNLLHDWANPRLSSGETRCERVPDKHGQPAFVVPAGLAQSEGRAEREFAYDVERELEQARRSTYCNTAAARFCDRDPTS